VSGYQLPLSSAGLRFPFPGLAQPSCDANRAPPLSRGSFSCTPNPQRHGKRFLPCGLRRWGEKGHLLSSPSEECRAGHLRRRKRSRPSRASSRRAI